jgi:hypothetical protein
LEFHHAFGKEDVGDVFSPENVEVTAFGNALAAMSFLQGLAAEELSPQELDMRTPGFEVTIAVTATKGRRPKRTSP